MPAKLKVFRTTSGFHDAYVAAPSRAAALRAWGATTDLFAMDAAAQVTDVKLMAEPLAKPGEVIKKKRGTEAEHIAAAGPGARAKVKAFPTPKPKPKPRPSRANLDKAEKRLAKLEAEHVRERLALEQEMAALRERQDASRRLFDAKQSTLEAARDEQADAYENEMRHWRAD